MEITAITTLWHRHEVWKIFKKANKMLVSVAGSEGTASEKICRGKKYLYTEILNDPLHRKFNAAANASKATNPDWVMITGSDNILSSNFISSILPILEDKKDELHYIGFTDAYQYCLNTQQCTYFEGYPPTHYRHGEPVGAYRFISRRLMDCLEWQPWGNVPINQLDFSVTKRINEWEPGQTILKMKDLEIVGLGLKSGEDYSKFNPKRPQENPAEILAYFPKSVQNMITGYK